jgi:hypothetical protein
MRKRKIKTTLKKYTNLLHGFQIFLENHFQGCCISKEVILQKLGHASYNQQFYSISPHSILSLLVFLSTKDVFLSRVNPIFSSDITIQHKNHK